MASFVHDYFYQRKFMICGFPIYDDSDGDNPDR